MQNHFDSQFSPSLQLGPIRQLLIQPTSFCNLSCSYCYLPESERNRKNQASLKMVERTFQFVKESGMCHDQLEIRWHSGEPLTRGLPFFQEAYRQAKSTFGEGRFWFSLQTNGTLINDDWCKFFKDIDAEVGVSLDGPKRFHDRHRLTRSGRGTFDQVIQAIDRLKYHRVPFDIICVAFEDLLKEPDEVHEFFSQTGCRILGFNTDDFDTYSDDALRDYRRFFYRFLELSSEHSPVIRELNQIREAIASPRHPIGNALTHPLAIVNVDANGNWTTFSPELLTIMAKDEFPYVIGNVFSSDLRSATSYEAFRGLAASISRGREQCRSSCPFFPICGGGSPSAKLYEHGTFEATETSYCRTRTKQIAHVVLADMEANTTASSVNRGANND